MKKNIEMFLMKRLEKSAEKEAKKSKDRFRCEETPNSFEERKA
ncbi:hypothetical protein [Paenibacillus sp. E194]|nr:hypothetical protein [Paenibacillus sp. E194]